MSSEAGVRSRYAMPGIAGLSGVVILLAGIGLLVTFAFPDIQQSGDAVLIAPSPLTVPAIVVGAALATFGGVFALYRSLGDPGRVK